jgi:hypothetical protein
VKAGYDRLAARLAAYIAQQKAKREHAQQEHTQREKGEEVILPPGQPAWLYGDGEFRLEVVGEAQYQRALRELCRSRTDEGEDHITEAHLVLEDTNRTDKNVVKIEIGSRKVGYLSRSDAIKFRLRLSLEGATERRFMCKANIVGRRYRRGKDEGQYMVWLDVCLQEQDL